MERDLEETWHSKSRNLPVNTRTLDGATEAGSEGGRAKERAKLPPPRTPRRRGPPTRPLSLALPAVDGMPPRGKAEEPKAAEEDPNKVLLKLQVKNGSSACFIDMADARVSAEQVRCSLRRGGPRCAAGAAGSRPRECLARASAPDLPEPRLPLWQAPASACCATFALAWTRAADSAGCAAPHGAATRKAGRGVRRAAQ